jgi:hypothetical protein
MERRRQSRGAVDTMDWDTKVLKRVTHHVESLAEGPPAGGGRKERFGWEEAALRALRRRIGRRGSE